MKKSSPYHLRSDGVFIVEDYNRKRAFANFFPGIAGEWGIPMWVFYTNRGQGIASFGIESKDKAIMEFQPANKSYRLTSTHGFRTFLKVKRGGVEKFYEPFRSCGASSFRVRQRMEISAHDLTIHEVNDTLGLEITVNYFTVPEEPLAGLARTVTVKNIASKAVAVEMVDGLPVIMPYGQNDWIMKNMCRTIEAWYKVRNLEKKAPYFQLNVEASDIPQVEYIKEGNFYFAFDPKAAPGILLDPVVEAGAVFGETTDLLVPELFLAQKAIRPAQDQQTDNRTPSAMSSVKFALKPSGVKEIVSITGFARSIGELNGYVKKATRKGFLAQKSARNRAIVEGIKSLAFTHTSSAAFNAYAGQTFLDNVLRGGLPLSLKTSAGPAVFNVYSRKHGDLERDYNAFKLSPTFLSQGNGNYRDVNQNRRNDVWFNSDLKQSAVVNFFSLTQADGYNPLVVCGMSFVAEEGSMLDALIAAHVRSGATAALKDFLKKGFMPGDLFNFIADNGIQLKGRPQEFLGAVLGLCQKFETAQHGEGFWIDHWAYNLDLVESYLALYPENLRSLLVENRDFTFYQNSVHVQPRDKRYVLTPLGVRQYHSLHEGKHDKGQALHLLRVRHGQGEIYRTNLLVKLLCLVVNKAATLDPSGIGIDMEANKPSWYDSLNGLPGLLGSSICETLELKRFALFTLGAIDKIGKGNDENIAVFEELALFIREIKVILEEAASDVDHWNKANTAKEDYREKVRAGISGVEMEMSFSVVRSFLEAVVRKVDRGVARAKREDGLFPTYFFHKVTRHELVEGAAPAKEGPHVRPLAFERHDLPLFLEGFVHALRCEPDRAAVRALHAKVRRSPLFDKALGMYKVNAPIITETEEIGRARIFPRGWLENESIWLHMEYKYLLELLRRGLHEEFYQDLATCCVAFMDPQTYGRSILENSSFIVASAHADKALHGQGFVARLSGSTAEFVHMWMVMGAGVAPFSVNVNGELELALKPVLKGSLFSTQEADAIFYTLEGEQHQVRFPAGTCAFNFMGRTLIVYHNPKRHDTFGPRNAVIRRVILHYAGKKTKEISGSVVPAPFAEDVRAGKVARIDMMMES